MTRLLDDTMILIPIHRSTKMECEDSVEKLVQAHGGAQFKARGLADVCQARSFLAKGALEQTPPPEFMLWVDDDMMFTPRDVQQLKQALLADPELDVIGSVYMNRTGNKFCFNVLGDGKEDRAVKLDGSVLPAWGVGMGLTLCRRRAFERAEASHKYPVQQTATWGVNYFAPIMRPEADETELPVWFTDDYAFCCRVRDGGGNVAVHTGVWARHVSEIAMGWWHWFALQQHNRPLLEDEPELQMQADGRRRIEP